MSTYVNGDKDVPTCREDMEDTLIEEVLETPLEDNSDDASSEPAPMACEVADSCLNSLVNLFQQHEGTEGFLRFLGEMSFVAAHQFAK